MTVYERVGKDIKDGCPIREGAPGACAICGAHTFLRYGCCFHCAKATEADDPRLEGYPRVGGKPEPHDELASHPMPTDHCPTCEAKVDRATMVTGDVAGGPDVGDLSICFSCGAFNEFTRGMALIPMKPETRRAISIDKMATMLRIQAKIRARGPR